MPTTLANVTAQLRRTPLKSSFRSCTVTSMSRLSTFAWLAGMVWQKDNSSNVETAYNKVCGFSWVCASWFMQRDTAVEFSNVFLALWAPQAECHPVQLNVREGGNLHWPISPKLSNLHKNNLDQGSLTSVGLRVTSRKHTDMEGNLFYKIPCPSVIHVWKKLTMKAIKTNMHRKTMQQPAAHTRLYKTTA